MRRGSLFLERLPFNKILTDALTCWNWGRQKKGGETERRRRERKAELREKGEEIGDRGWRIDGGRGREKGNIDDIRNSSTGSSFYTESGYDPVSVRRKGKDSGFCSSKSSSTTL